MPNQRQVPSPVPEPRPTRMPHAIVLGSDVSRPGVRITKAANSAEYESSRPLHGGGAMGSQLSALFQAVPTLLIEEGHRGKHLMEVVINGDLVRAKGGEGFRAWAVDEKNRIKEHATLFESEGLQSAVNAAAVWQVASVVVAQKHLADISAKLDEIRSGLESVSQFLVEDRRSKVQGTYEYLQTAVAAIREGDLSPAVRFELESCERELLQVQNHLLEELRRRAAKSIENTDTVGTRQLERDILAKYQDLKGLGDDIRLTLKTRALAWYVLSLYPGDTGLKRARMEAILRSAEDAAADVASVQRFAEQDGDGVASWFNRNTTLSIRKTNIKEVADAASETLASGVAEAARDVHAADALLLHNDAPTRLLLEIRDGRIAGVRMTAEPAGE